MKLKMDRLEKKQTELKSEKPMGSFPLFQYRRRLGKTHPKVLIISQELKSIQHFRKVLKPLKVFLLFVPTGKEALSMVQREDVDLIILEMATPCRDAFDFLERIRRHYVDLPIFIVMSHSQGNGIVEGISHCHSLGSFDLFWRPLDEHLFRNVVKEALMKKRWGRVLVFSSETMKEVHLKALKVAETHDNVCILGESGTGKELIAKNLYYSNPPHQRIPVILNCPTLSEELMEKVILGRIEENTGLPNPPPFHRIKKTVFLDEVGELSPSLQNRLLGMIEKGVDSGAENGYSSGLLDLQIISTTANDLKALVHQGKFREDLYYRINVISIVVPPLRERREDIPVLAKFFLEKLNWENDKFLKGVTPEAMNILMNYDWPGNVRELENCLQQAALFCWKDWIGPEDFSFLRKKSRTAIKRGSSWERGTSGPSSRKTSTL